jgi:hypothetical protein
MTKTRKVLRTLVVLGLVGGLAAVGAFSAFTSQTDNPGNVVSAGSVNLTDNDSNDTTPLYDILNAKPGDTESHCITVTYNGTLPANVKFWNATGALGPLAAQVDLVVQSGTGGNFTCVGFTPDAGAPLFNAKLNTFPTTSGTALQDGPGAGLTWNQNDAVTYRFTATLPSATGNGAQGQSTNLHTFRWEATNQ